MRKYRKITIENFKFGILYNTEKLLEQGNYLCITQIGSNIFQKPWNVLQFYFKNISVNIFSHD